MTETIKVEIDEALAKRFRKKAMERHGYKKGAMKSALEEVITKYTLQGNVDWESLRGSLKMKTRVTSVELQHTLWSNRD